MSQPGASTAGTAPQWNRSGTDPSASRSDTSSSVEIKLERPSADPAGTAATTDGAQVKKEQWNRNDPLPEGWAYAPFYGKKRGTSHLEKESEDVKGVTINWVCRQPQDAKTKEDDVRATRSIEIILARLGQWLGGFTYVWIVHNPRKPTPNIADGGVTGTPEWSLGVCFGSDADHRMVYGNIFIKVEADNNRVVLSVMGTGGDGLAGRRALDLWVAQGDIPRPFAARETAKPTRKTKKSGVDTDGKTKIIAAKSGKGDSKVLKVKAGGVAKKTKRGKNKGKGKGIEDFSYSSSDSECDGVVRNNNTYFFVQPGKLKVSAQNGKFRLETL
ncbi:hypothetical protein PG999_009164 [Apiospora kogelbergensis]|uniref:Uncharacterized protein n=1 Tax=Apiospora kogelbergensis TaxID=1337665 RepID=A0AAW0QP01_9PEZI